MSEETQTTEPLEEQPTEQVVEETPEATEPEPHPLEPGGRRFSEVYGEMKDARREAQDLRERLARLEGAQAAQQRPAQQPQAQFYTAEQLQAAVDRGVITPAKMSEQLAWQQTQLSEQRLRQQIEQESKAKEAYREVESYIDKVPALRKQDSPEMLRVAREAREIADEMGRHINDPVVQRRALRAVFGSLEQVSKVTRAPERGNSNRDTGTSGLGGVAASAKKDPLKGVPQHYIDHWKRMRYTPEQMAEEAKYIKPRRSR